MTEPTRTGGAIGRLDTVCIDVSDLERAAVFWGTLLGLQPGKPRGQYLRLGKFTSNTWLLLQRVPETKIVKNRIHLDIDVTDIEEATRQVVALGGVALEDRDDGQGPFSVMADPDGNEFCLISTLVEFNPPAT